MRAFPTSHASRSTRFPCGGDFGVARCYGVTMRSPPRFRSVLRIIVAVIIAIVAIVRGGGAAIACESLVPAADAGMAHDSHTPAPPVSEHEDCEAPERVSECLLMPACAPAVSAAATTTTDLAVASTVATLESPRAPAPVDRSPEPPPPRV
jgi:hypothetical protein